MRSDAAIGRAALGAVLILLAAIGCGTNPSRGHAQPVGTSTGGPVCPSAPPVPRATSGDTEQQPLPPPALDDVSDGRFMRPLVLDDALHIEPPRTTDEASYAGGDAVCEVLAASGSNGGAIGRQSSDSIAVGLSRVTLPDGLLGHSAQGDVQSQGSVDGVPDVNPSTPAPTPYHDRLAWVAIVAPLVESSCPAAGPGDTPRPSHDEPGHHGYEVFVLDASTGGDALLYTERRNGGCPGTRPDGPWVDVPLTAVSLPWTLVSEQADRSSAQVSFHVSPCDGYSGVILVEDVTDPATVPVVVQRPFGPLCGDQNPLVEKMRAANVGTTLPPHLEHAPTGPYVQ